MKNKKTDIDICIGTYKRPKLLKSLLQSLANQHLDNLLSIRIIIIDNDLEQSAKAIVEDFRRSTSIPIIYDIEQSHGISFVRNRALKNVTANYFAFLDDDEVAASNWLLSLYNALITFDADVVFGPVLSVLPDNRPEWALSHPSFKHIPRETGAQRISGATNNVLLRKNALGSPHQEFNPDFALTGGGDTEFFHKLYLAGKQLIWCEEATVYEHIPLERTSIEWVRKRAFRGGQCFYRIFIRRYSKRKKVIWLLTKPLQFIVGLIAIPFLRLYSYPLYIRILCRVASSAGQLTGSIKAIRYREYADHNIITDSKNNAYRKG